MGVAKRKRGKENVVKERRWNRIMKEVMTAAEKKLDRFKRMLCKERNEVRRRAREMKYMRK